MIQDLNKIFHQPCTFLAGVQKPSQMIPCKKQEIAFVGRSNVGKSSLLNALLFRKKLARISHRPGRTQQINFFQVGELFVFVDLPGYGFAQVSKSTQMEWQDLISGYLINRPCLTCIIMLIDGRHGIKANDHQTMMFLDRIGINYYVVCTKMDKVKKADALDLKETLEGQLSQYPAAYPKPFFVSVQNEDMLNVLRGALWEKIK